MMTCFVEGCSQTFHCYSTFNSHIFRNHRGVDLESEAKKSHGSYTEEDQTHLNSMIVDGGIVEEACNEDLTNAGEIESRASRDE